MRQAAASARENSTENSVRQSESCTGLPGSPDASSRRFRQTKLQKMHTSAMRPAQMLCRVCEKRVAKPLSLSPPSSPHLEARLGLLKVQSSLCRCRSRLRRCLGRCSRGRAGCGCGALVVQRDAWTTRGCTRPSWPTRRSRQSTTQHTSAHTVASKIGGQRQCQISYLLFSPAVFTPNFSLRASAQRLCAAPLSTTRPRLPHLSPAPIYRRARMATKGVHLRIAHTEGRCSMRYSPDGKCVLGPASRAACGH